MNLNSHKVAIIVALIFMLLIITVCYNKYFDELGSSPIFRKSDYSKKSIMDQLRTQTFSLDAFKYTELLLHELMINKDLSFRLNQTTQCYEINGRPPIWLYWDKDKIPDFATVFADAIQCVNSEFHVLIVHDSTLTQFWPDVNFDLFDKLVPAHKADVVRVNLLSIYGGVYLDIDTFPTQSYYHYYQLLSEYDMIGPDWVGVGPIATGSMGPVIAGHPFFRVWSYWQAECMRTLINENVTSDPFGWPELLAWIAGPLADHMMRNHGLKYYAFRGRPTIGQLITRGLTHGWFEPLSNMSNPLWNLTATPILSVTHAGQEKKFDKLTLNEILSPSVNDSVFTYFAKCALSPCYENLSTIERLGKSQPGGVYLSDYFEFVSVAPEYKCYKFNDSIPQKISDPKFFNGKF